MKKNYENIQQEKILLIINDGLGFNREKSSEILQDTWSLLDKSIRNNIDRICNNTKYINKEHLIAPIISEQINPLIESNLAQEMISTSRKIRSSLPIEQKNEIRSIIRETSHKYRYVPWVSKFEKIENLRNKNFTWPTRAAGMWVGYENISPTIQGNSETGHQQIGNLSLARQVTMEINDSIKKNTFFYNKAINSIIDDCEKNTNDVIVSTLLSGIRGDDGKVHSSWDHLESTLKLLFNKRNIPPERVHIHAIIDGRDSYEFGSIKSKNGTGNYLGILQQLLKKFNAENSLKWVIGRSMAMDRDYREQSAKQNYNLITKSIGKKVKNFNELRKYIENLHQSDITDQDIPPIIIADNLNTTKKVTSGDAFINLNFRADRQIITTACLVNDQELLLQESSKRNKKWELSWIDEKLQLNICTMTEYHPKFKNIKIAFKIKPQENNFFSKWDSYTNNAKYLLVAESVKSAHMGYFIRGKRELPLSNNECRYIIKTLGKDEGINSDTDFYKFPKMRNCEISEYVIRKIQENKHQLIACNLAATDMIGHLLPKHYIEAVTAYESSGKAIYSMVKTALQNDFTIIITSDHGNIENDTPSHTSNDVLTTIISKKELICPSRKNYIVNLFDIFPTILKIMNIKSKTNKESNSSYNGCYLVK
ncbi:MAG: hypothetical protein CL780_00355 [Chloroflexi bacterium]|nr:hypothetical protein [Chloroflexota bacterium]